MPVLHEVAALLRAHTALQAPQSVFVRMLRSQPLGTIPSQFAKPVLHAVNVHAPVLQSAPVAFCGLHALPQVPQVLSVTSEVSQPSDVDGLQLPQVALQVPIAHLLFAMHTGVAFASTQSPHLGMLRTVPQLSVATRAPHSAPAAAHNAASVAAGQPHTFASPVPPHVTPVPVHVPHVTVRVWPQLSAAV